MREHNNYIMGRNTIMEILQHKPEILLKVFVGINEKSQNKKATKILEELKTKQVPIKYVSKQALFSFVGSDSHQSFVAQIKHKNYTDLKSFFKKTQYAEKSFVVMLDSISDPQNMGAIFRSAECFNVDAVVYSKNRGCDITPVVSKTACGATELIPSIKISNLVQTAKEFKKEGFTIVVAENTKEAVSLINYPFSENKKTMLIVGSEELGIQQLLKKEADLSVKIPLLGKIESLNVAQATAVLLAFMQNS